MSNLTLISFVIFSSSLKIIFHSAENCTWIYKPNDLKITCSDNICWISTTVKLHRLLSISCWSLNKDEVYGFLPALNESFVDSEFQLTINPACIPPKKISTISKKYPSIYKLSLRFLYIKNITGLFDIPLSIKELSLLGNKIKTVSDVDFQNLRQLEKIDLSKNPLKTLPPKLFKFNSALKRFVLRNNADKLVISDDFLSNQRNLQSVTLSNNNIENVPEGAFTNCENLENVDLSRNKLKQLNG